MNSDSHEVPSWWEAAVGTAVVFVFVMFLVLTSGCSSTRFAVLDLDFRSPAQIQAGKAADCAPFCQTADCSEPASERALPLAWWQLVLAAFSDLECRIRFVSIERGGPCK